LGDGAQDQPPADPGEGPTARDVIAQGQHSGVHDNRTVIVTSLDQWVDLWDAHAANREPAPERPSVDFTFERVVAVFTGPKPTGCHGVSVHGISHEGRDVHLQVLHHAPEDRACPRVVTHPYVMLVIPAGDGAVTVAHHATTDPAPAS
jgi:hypothetical protein